MSNEVALEDLKLRAEADWFDPLFRVVTTAGRPRGIRLERVFWKLLDDIAARRGVRRSKLIEEVLRDDWGAPGRVARTLRCFVADTIETERFALTTRISSSQAVDLMHQAPLPSFSIDRMSRLHKMNNEFARLVEEQRAGGDDRKPVVSLTLDIGIEAAFADAFVASATSCHYTLQVDDLRRRGRAKLVGVPDGAQNTLVGYVLS